MVIVIPRTNFVEPLAQGPTWLSQSGRQELAPMVYWEQTCEEGMFDVGLLLMLHFQDTPHGVTRDQQFFIRRNDVNRGARSFPANQAFPDAGERSI